MIPSKRLSLIFKEVKIMTVKALKTLKNAYDQVLFREGHEYKAKMSPKRVFILNELHTETLVRANRFGESFEVVDYFD